MSIIFLQGHSILLCSWNKGILWLLLKAIMKLKLSSLFSMICLQGRRSVVGMIEWSIDGMCGFMSVGAMSKTCLLLTS